MRIIDQLHQSLLSSSPNFYADMRTQNHQGEPNIQRLKRKIVKSLPEGKIVQNTVISEGMFCGKAFDPTSNFILSWYVVIILLIYLYFIQVPIAVAFDDPRSQNQKFFYSINFFVIFLFLFDICINLNTGFYEDGELQTDPSKIKMQYLKKNLALDVLSITAIFCFQLGNLVPQIDKKDEYLRYIYIIFFCRLAKVAKLQRTVLISLDLNRKTKATFKLVLLLIKIFFVCNLVACAGFMLSKYLVDNVSIINADGSKCEECFWIAATKQGDQSLINSTFNVKYVYSLYWASTTMISIGYGDITPKNSYEVTFTVVIQFLSCLLYAYAINEIWSSMLELNRKKTRINARLTTINIYMRDKGISAELNSRINGYLTNYYYAKNLREREIQNEIMGQLTPALKKQLFYDSYSILLKHKYFNSMQQHLIVSACQNVKEICCYEDQSLSTSDFQSSPSLYYLKKGELKRQYGGLAKLLIQNQYKGDYIGIFEFITQLSYLSQLTAIQYSLAYYIKYCHWRTALLEERGCFQYFYLTKQSLMLYSQFTRIGQNCYFCSLQNHRTQLCFDYKLRKQVQKSYQSCRKSQNLHRKPQFMRRKFTIKIGEKKVRKKSFCKGTDFHLKRDVYNPYNNSMTLIDFLDYSTQRNWSIVEQSDLRRGGKFFVKLRQKHQTHMLQTIRGQYANKPENSVDQQILSEQIRFREMSIDILALYQEYYPEFNCSELNPRQVSRKKNSRSFYR